MRPSGWRWLAPRAKRYLGDAVYVAPDVTGGVVLTTEDGRDATNTIVLEPEVLDALLRLLVQS